LEDLSFLENQEPNLDTLSKLGEKVKELIDKRKAIDFLDAKLKEAKADEFILSGETIPTLLLSCGLTSLILDTGEKITVKEKLAVTMPKKDIKKRQVVFKWLIEIGGEYLIKKELTVEEPEKHIVDYLREKAIPFENKLNVNTNSLKAFLAEKLGMKKGSLQTLEIQDVPKETSPFIYKETKLS